MSPTHMLTERLPPRGRHRGWRLAAIVLAAASCGTPSPTPSPSGIDPTAGPTAETPEPGEPTPEGSPGPSLETTPATVLLEEVLYLPAAGGSAFVELANVSDGPVLLAPLTLIMGEAVVLLERAGLDLAPGARLVVKLDGGAGVDGGTYHAAPSVTLDPTAGSASIVNAFGDPIDEVAWGAAPGAVATSRGGVTRELEPGSSIGRAPGATGARDRLAWVVYTPDQVSPGAVNPPAPVGGLHPISGAVVPTRAARLSWFPVPGATAYRVQVAADESFASPVLDTEVAETSVDVSGLAPGTYVWHVQSVTAAGSVATYSELSQVELAAEGTGVVFAVSTTPVKLPVPLISQHKDTKMLLLESRRPDGPHAWDVDHDQLDTTDPADNTNCVLASLAMMNHFAGGDLTQDRIGFESHQNDQPGPEYDLNYGSVFDTDEITRLYSFALGVTPTHKFAGSVDRLWGDVVSSIDRGIPVLAGTPDHVFVITGYAIQDDHRLVALNDPWSGRYEVDIDSFDPTSAGRSPAVTWDYWLADRIRPVHGENIILDSDGDGVVDFDENERFMTDPNLVDTDLDGVHDREDIYASVFDGEHGYAYVRTGRDFDQDSLPMERDPDSDQGGCEDGLEDKNGNGLWEFWLNESWNFDAKDDACKELAGTITWTFAASGTDGVTSVSQSGSLTVGVRLKPDPADPGGYLDDGSTFSFRHTLETRVPIDDCTQVGRQWVSESGDFSGDYGSLDAHVHDDIILLSAEQLVSTDNVADLCIPGMSVAVGTADTSAVFPSECEGNERAGPGPGRTFVFDCPRSPAPPAEYGYTTWTVHGSLTTP